MEINFINFFNVIIKPLYEDITDNNTVIEKDDSLLHPFFGLADCISVVNPKYPYSCGYTTHITHVKFIRTFRIAMKRRYLNKTLKSRCRTIIMINKIDYKDENIPQDLKEYLK